MKRIAFAAIAISVVVLAGCSSNDTTPASTHGDAGGYTDIHQLPQDPYSTNGDWKIPEQIQPGVYKVLPGFQDVVSLRWYHLCSDSFCQQQIPGTTQYAQEGGTYLTIPSDGSVKGFHNNGVRLTTP